MIILNRIVMHSIRCSLLLCNVDCRLRGLPVCVCAYLCLLDTFVSFAKRLNRSRWCLGCVLGWAHRTIRRGDTDPSEEGAMWDDTAWCCHYCSRLFCFRLCFYDLVTCCGYCDGIAVHYTAICSFIHAQVSFQ